jgi:hypothetical protein
MSEHSIHLIGGEDEEVATVEATSLRKDLCAVAISYRGKTLHAENRDYFEAFRDVRKLMEEDGLIPFCYGASLNVYPSGMSRQMAQGMVAYRMTLGKSTSREDLVRIFDAGPDVIPAFAKQQREYFERWVTSFAV